MEIFRKLHKHEIDSLIAQGCRSTEWEGVSVQEGFSISEINFTEFVGTIKIYCQASHPVKISFATIINSTIEYGVTIKNVGRALENCYICEGSIIENVAHISTDGLTTHGFAEKISVLVESGGREVLLHPKLSAQIAYLQAFLTSNDFKENLARIMKDEDKNRKHNLCTIGRSAVIRDCGRIVNSDVGEGAEISGAIEIVESTINGKVGAGSSVSKSIVAENGFVGVGCVLERCFVADSAVVDAGFTAENSLFFANSECLRGEACAVFAAPFTSSHHKSTLLLAAIYSFFTAGSGSNFSNHRFKLGPLHQGVVERGSKTGSSSYLLWPSRIAPFTSVIGRHAKVVDTSIFPFSLLVRENNKSILLPGSLLFSSGYERDTTKWLERDKRSSRSVDVINVQPLNPYTVEKILKAIDTLKLMLDGYVPEELVGVEVPREFIHKSLARYHAGVNFYYGKAIAEALETYYYRNERVTSHCIEKACAGEWVDIAGLIAPKEFINEIVDDIINSKLSSYSEINAAFARLGSNYKKYKWEWVLSKLGNINIGDDDSKSIVENVLTNWRKAAELRLELVKRDANKEYVDSMKIGYGLLEGVGEDFSTVRGEFEDNSFVKKVEAQTRDIIARSDALLAKILL